MEENDQLKMIFASPFFCVCNELKEATMEQHEGEKELEFEFTDVVFTLKCKVKTCQQD